jgi:uncharacterized protein
MMLRRLLLAGALGTPAMAYAQAPPAKRQDKSQDKGFYANGTKQRAVRFAGGDGAMLAGTLLLPIRSELGRVPGIVLVAGSGPTDRDGNNPLAPERINLVKQIADLLADVGIATLRYDKRGIGGSTARPRNGLAEQERYFSWDNFVGDVVAAHAELVKHDEIKAYATALLGHSEGGLLALAAVPAIAKSKPHALVLASTPGRPMSDIVRAQIARGAPQLVEGAERVMATIQATGHVPADLPRELEALFPAYAGPFLQRLLAFDPAQALLALDQACLVVQGGADRQVVPMGDVQPLIEALAKRTAPGEAAVIAAVSHNLKLVTWPSDPGLAGPIAPAVATKLTSWLVPLLGA